MARLQDTAQDLADSPADAGTLSISAPSATRLFLEALFAELERASVRYCVLHSWDTLPDRITSDLDMAVHPADWRRLGCVVSELRRRGYLPVQLRNYAVNGERIDFAWWDGGLQFAAVDWISEYRYSGVILSSATELVAGRCRHPRGFWTASPKVEFEYLLAKNTLKREISEKRQARLRQLARELGDEARRTALRFFGPHYGEQVWRALADSSAPLLLPSLRPHVRKRQWGNHPAKLIRYIAADCLRLLRRWSQPTGLFIGVLGPDGVGKNTLLDAIAQRWTVPFRSVHMFHWRPGVVRKLRHFGRPVPEPHKYPARGRLSSVASLLLCVADYWFAHARMTAIRARSGLILFNRYYHDLLVDPLRYRYGGPSWLARTVARLIPPSERLVLVLDADEQTIQSRKNELSLDELRRQRREYRQLLQHRGFRELKVDGGVDAMVESADRLILDFLSERFRRRHPELVSEHVGFACKSSV